MQIRLEPLTPQDMPELSNEDWTTSVFGLTWLQLVNKEQVYKLIRADEQDKRIQGLVHVGAIAPGRTYLTESLLEAAPFNIHQQDRQEHRGVGRILVARLAAESILLGKGGRVLVRPRTGTETFYMRLGFYALPPLNRNYALDEEPAAALLQSACLR